jgi:hypothetical protein
MRYCGSKNLRYDDDVAAAERFLTGNGDIAIFNPVVTEFRPAV